MGKTLLSEPSEKDDYFGSKVSEDDQAAIMMGVTMALGSFGFAAGHIQQFCYCRLLGVNRIFFLKILWGMYQRIVFSIYSQTHGAMLIY